MTNDSALKICQDVLISANLLHKRGFVDSLMHTIVYLGLLGCFVLFTKRDSFQSLSSISRILLASSKETYDVLYPDTTNAQDAEMQEITHN